MMWIIIIGLLVFFFVVQPFLRDREVKNFGSYLAMPDEVRHLINTEKVFELSEILVGLEINKEYQLCEIILEAIDSKGYSFARRVDKVRNEMRIQAGLGSLKMF